MLEHRKNSRTRCTLVASSIIALACTAPALAFPLQEAVAAAGESTQTAAEAAELRAVFIHVSGKVEWRSGPDAPWKRAAVDDVLTAGAEVRSGMRSSAALRTGRNATILVDAGTQMVIPMMMQEGETLRTTVSVKSGRADFKVDKVGLTNDFRVVTPSTTLAVRGTEFALATGALKQVEIVGARTNIINAIELKYALTNRTVNLSGHAMSSSAAPNPAHAQLLATATPTVTGTHKDKEEEAVKEAVAGPAPVESGSHSGLAKQNNTSTRSENEEGVSENSINGAVHQAVRLAIQRTEAAIAYMIQAAHATDMVEAQRDTLAALKQLADARRDEAMAALASHQQALQMAQATLADAQGANVAFAGLSSTLGHQLDTFYAQQASASDLLSTIENVLTGTQSGEDLQTLAQQAADALIGMNETLDSVHGTFGDIGQQLAAVNALLACMDVSAMPQAAAAIQAYQNAMASLQALATAGAGPLQIAGAAQQAVTHLQALIAQLAGQAQTPDALTAAQHALQALANANQALAQSQATLAAIQAAHAAAGNAGSAAQLGMVQQLYQQIVAIRTAMANAMLAQAGLIDQADGITGQTNSYAEGVFAMLGGYWKGVAATGNAEASQAASAAQQSLCDANTAHGQFTQAVVAAEDMLTGVQTHVDHMTLAAGEVSAAYDNLTLAAADATASLNNIGCYGTSAMEGALLALDALEQALGQIVAQYSGLQEVSGTQPNTSAMAQYQAQGSAALEALLAAVANAQNAANQAGDSAANAASAAEAAAAVQALALELAERFGLNMDGALAAAAQAYAEALAAGNAAGQAGNALQSAQALALLAQADAISNIAAQIDALLAQSNNLSATALAQLQAAQASYVGVNEHGTQVFAGLTTGAAQDAVAQQMVSQSAMASLSEMASVSTAYVAALDGAEGAANSAEGAAREAKSERLNAEYHYGQTQMTFAQMNDALAQYDYDAALLYGDRTITNAGYSDDAANASRNHAESAAGHFQSATQYAAAAETLQGVLAQYGADSAQFQAAAAAFNAQVDAANQAMTNIQANAAFYDSVAQMLAGRAGTAVAQQAASNSADAHNQVLAIAAQLAASAENAALLEQTARSNAERMFFRSARQYVERAGKAATQAAADAAAARVAADNAAKLAAQAYQGGDKR